MFKTTLLLMVMVASVADAGAVVIAADDFESFSASGLAPGGTDGALDSNAWRVTGVSDGDSDFGDRRPGGDYGRGPSGTPVRSGGIHALELPGGSVGLGVQATGSDFSPGALIRRVANGTKSVLEDLALSFELWVFNDAARASAVNLQIGLGDEPVSWIPIEALSIESPSTPASPPSWQRSVLSASLPVPELAPNDTLQIRWLFEDAFGTTGGRDELAIDALHLDGNARAPALELASPATMSLLGVAMALSFAVRRRSPSRICHRPVTRASSPNTNMA